MKLFGFKVSETYLEELESGTLPHIYVIDCLVVRMKMIVVRVSITLTSNTLPLIASED